MRKRLLIFLICLVSVLLAGYVTLRMTAPQHRITMENIGAIKKGMTEKDVEALLGVRAGDYSSSQKVGMFFEDAIGSTIFPALSGPDLVKKRGGQFWVGEESCVWIRFDGTGKVAQIFGFILPNQNVSFLDKLRRWVGI